MLSNPKFENGIFEDTYRTHFSQVGTHDVLTNKSILSILENIADAHSVHCHFTFSDVAKFNLTWVILSWKLQVLKKIEANINIKVQTWCSGVSKAFFYRDFKIFDEQNNLCAVATSKWCLVDMATSKISPMPPEICNVYNIFHEETVFGENDVVKITLPSNNPIFSDTYKIRRFDLDLNKHVHNLNYLNIAYELLPDEIYDGDELNNVEILYKRELKYGDTVKSYLYKDGDCYYIVLKSLDETTIHSIIKLF